MADPGSIAEKSVHRLHASNHASAPDTHVHAIWNRQRPSSGTIRPSGVQPTSYSSGDTIHNSLLLTLSLRARFQTTETPAEKLLKLAHERGRTRRPARPLVLT